MEICNEWHYVTIIACIIDLLIIQKTLTDVYKKHPTMSNETSLLPPMSVPPEFETTQ
jgi:hypothetical protein